jgi:hypothetical protein
MLNYFYNPQNLKKMQKKNIIVFYVEEHPTQSSKQKNYKGRKHVITTTIEKDVELLLQPTELEKNAKEKYYCVLCGRTPNSIFQTKELQRQKTN